MSLRGVIYLLLLVPSHMFVAQLIGFALSFVAPADLLMQIIAFVPLHVLVTSSLSSFMLKTWVISAAVRPCDFGPKTWLGSALWTTFVLLISMGAIYLGYLIPPEAMVIAAVLLVIGNALMMRLFWTAQPPARG